MSDAAPGEDVESFRLRARAWLAKNMPPATPRIRSTVTPG